MPKRATKSTKVTKGAAKPKRKAKAPKPRAAKAPAAPSPEQPPTAAVPEQKAPETLPQVGGQPIEGEVRPEAVEGPAAPETPSPSPSEAPTPAQPAAAEAMTVEEETAAQTPLLPISEQAEALPPAAVPASLPVRETESTTAQVVVEGPPPRREVPPNHIFIGKKPIMSYALSGVMQLTQYPEVVLRARGKAISSAVDVAEVIINRLGSGKFVVRSIEIDTDVVGEGAERRNVSTIRISVGRKE